jgi:ABC-type branched-subunit amino acid transport system ATPase component
LAKPWMASVLVPMTPDDAGKTTALTLMGGLYTPDAGTILLGTESVTALPSCRISLAGLLSGGEQHMLTLARGLLAAPHILLLDEPSLGLAPIWCSSSLPSWWNGATLVQLSSWWTRGPFWPFPWLIVACARVRPDNPCRAGCSAVH